MHFLSFFQKGPFLKKRSVILIVVFSILVGTGLPITSYYSWKALKMHRQKSDAYLITTLFQRCPNRETLKTPYLAQMLDLSIDKPKNLYRFDEKAAAKCLLTYPMMEWASVSKRKPNSLTIDYGLRRPLVKVANFTNTALDKAGILFPLTPFYTVKKLPSVVFGDAFLSDVDLQSSRIWGRPMPQKRMELLFSIIHLLEELEGIKIQTIDLSKVDAPSYGKREIVVIVEDRGETYLRLSPKNYAQELAHYAILRREHTLLPNSQKIMVDLRISEVAYVKNL